MLQCSSTHKYSYIDVSTNYQISDDVNVSCTVDVETTEVAPPIKTLTEAARDVDNATALVRNLEYSEESVAELAKLTSGQADNPLWFNQRGQDHRVKDARCPHQNEIYFGRPKQKCRFLVVQFNGIYQSVRQHPSSQIWPGNGG